MNKSLKTLFLLNGIFVFASNLLGPLYAIYVSGIDKSILAVSSSWAVFLVGTTVFTYIVSRFGDRVKEKEYLLALGYLVRGLVWTSYIFVGSFAMLMALQVLLGLGESLGTPSYDAVFAEHLDKDKHIKDYATWKVISNLLGATAVFLGGLIVSSFGFTPLFIAMSSLAFISLIGIVLTPRDLL